MNKAVMGGKRERAVIVKENNFQQVREWKGVGVDRLGKSKGHTEIHMYTQDRGSVCRQTG
jgi:hypothetical protein